MLCEELFYSDERVFSSRCNRISCTESTKLPWPALKSRLAELYFAILLGNRASILAQLKDTVPQFAYEGCEQASPESGLHPNPATSLAAVSEAADLHAPFYPVWSVTLEPVSNSAGN